MKKLLSSLFLMIVVGLVVAAVASYMSKKRLESKSDDEIREFLARKLDGRVGEEQLATIQDAVIGGIRGKSARTDATESDEDTTEAESGEEAEEATVDEEVAPVEDEADDDVEGEDDDEDADKVSAE